MLIEIFRLRSGVGCLLLLTDLFIIFQCYVLVHYSAARALARQRSTIAKETW